jgi:hypothetical protein
VGDYYVDGGMPSSGNGLTPETAMQTIQEAITAINAVNDGSREYTVVVDPAQTYREEVNFTGRVWSNLEITTRGTGRAKLSGGEVATGFTQCTSTDQPTVGANFAQIYKTDITLPTGIDPEHLGLQEDGNPLVLCFDRASSPFIDDFNFTISTWHTATALNGATDTTTVIGDTISTYTSTEFSAYTEAQLQNAELLITYTDNRTRGVAISSFNSGTNTVTISNPDGFTVEDNTNRARFALRNILPALTDGQWGYTISGSTVTLYVRSNDGAPGEITYIARPRIFDTNNMRDVTIRGLELDQTRSIFSRSSTSAIPVADRINRSNNLITQNVMGNCYGPSNNPMIQIDGMEDVLVRYNDLDRSIGGRGIQNLSSRRVQVFNNHITRIERQPILSFGGVTSAPFSRTTPPTQGWAEFMFNGYNLIENCSFETHSNAMNFFTGSRMIRNRSNKEVNVNGFHTYQDASDISWEFNEFSGNDRDPSSGRTIASQQRGGEIDRVPAPPVITGQTGYNNPAGSLGVVQAINNTLLPLPSDLTNSANMFLGEPATDDDMLIHVRGNVIGGGGINTNTAAANVGDQIDNIFLRSPISFGTNDTVVSATDIYTDPANGDFTPVQNSEFGILTADPSARLQAFKTAFETEWNAASPTIALIDVPLLSDINGREFTASTVPTGAQVQDFAFVPPPFTPGQGVAFPATAFLQTTSLGSTPSTQQLTMSFWMNTRTAWNANTRLLTLEDSSGNERFTIARSSSSRMIVTMRDNTGANIAFWRFPSNPTFNPVNTWLHHLITIDTTTGTARHFINDVEITYSGRTVTTNGTMPGNLTQLFINSTSAAGNGNNQEMWLADVYLNLAEAIDMDTVADRRKFISATGGVVSLGSDGTTPLSTAPQLYLSNNAADFGNNRAPNNGNLAVENGPLTDAPSDPPT